MVADLHAGLAFEHQRQSLAVVCHPMDALPRSEAVRDEIQVLPLRR